MLPNQNQVPNVGKKIQFFSSGDLPNFSEK
jgi:hypothetical protein